MFYIGMINPAGLCSVRNGNQNGCHGGQPSNKTKHQSGYHGGLRSIVTETQNGCHGGQPSRRGYCATVKENSKNIRNYNS